jgi:hypothetical protein
MLRDTRHRGPNIIQWAFTFVPTCAIVLSCVGFLVTRVQMFSEALNSEIHRRTQEAWLRQECKKPEFYANMQNHADLCDKVEAHARAHAWLAALSHLFQNTYLCGYMPCATVLDRTLEWVAGHGLLFTGLLVVFAVLLPTVLLPAYRSHLNDAAEKYVSVMYNTPYGRDHYFGASNRYAQLKDE